MHKDNDGNVISMSQFLLSSTYIGTDFPTADPDRSNPTRHRLERPLDTIRAFHAAAEGTSSRRSSYTSRPGMSNTSRRHTLVLIRSGSQVGYNGDTRRASYYSQNGYSPQAPRMSPGGGYYRNSAYGMAPQSTVEESPGASQMYARGSMRQPTHPHARQPYGNHNGYQNGYHNGEMPMSTHSYQQSYDAMTSGSEEYTKSTNPSSQNSSYDKLHQLRTKPEEFPQENPYAKEIQFNHVSPTQPFSPYDVDHRTGQITPPAAPSKGFVQLPANGFAQPPANNPKQPIKLNGTTTAEITPPTSPKKQSWIKRRFSKRAS